MRRPFGVLYFILVIKAFLEPIYQFAPQVNPNRVHFFSRSDERFSMIHRGNHFANQEPHAPLFKRQPVYLLHHIFTHAYSPKWLTYNRIMPKCTKGVKYYFSYMKHLNIQ